MLPSKPERYRRFGGCVTIRASRPVSASVRRTVSARWEYKGPGLRGACVNARRGSPRPGPRRSPTGTPRELEGRPRPDATPAARERAKEQLPPHGWLSEVRTPAAMAQPRPSVPQELRVKPLLAVPVLVLRAAVREELQPAAVSRLRPASRLAWQGPPPEVVPMRPGRHSVECC